MNPGFIRMRDRLVERGWIEPGTFRITDAGMAETDRILGDLIGKRPPPTGPFVVWNFTFRQRRR